MNNVDLQICDASRFFGAKSDNPQKESLKMAQQNQLAHNNQAIVPTEEPELVCTRESLERIEEVVEKKRQLDDSLCL